jgi:putative ABC transport system permease protein
MTPPPRHSAGAASGARATAAWGLLAYRGTAVLAVVMGTTVLAAALAVTLLARLGGGALGPRLVLSRASGAVVDPTWALARSPGALQSDAVRLLFQALAGAAGAALAVGGLGIVLLFAARASERVAEISLRRAVGARRRTLALAALLEGGAVATGSLVAGGLVGVMLARLAAAAWPGGLAPAIDAVPSLVAAAIAAISVLAGAMLALVFAPRRRLTDAAPRPVSLLVPTLQLGLALVILTASTLVTRHATDLRREGRAHGLDGEIYSGGVAAADPAVRSARYAALLESLRTGAGYDTVSLTGDGAAIGLGTLSVVTTDCGLCPSGGLLVPWHAVAAMHQVVSADTFQSLGIHLLAGRGVTDADGWNAPRVAVVSRSLALRHFQNGDAIGRRLLFGDDPRTWHTVVGIVEDPQPSGLGGALLPPFAVYASVLQHPAPAVELMLRPRAGQLAGRTLEPELRRVLDAAGGVIHISEASLLAAQLAPVAWFGRLFAAEGWAMLVAALIATLVQMRLWVLSLAPELGLRRAVGARAGQVVALVLWRAALVGAGGVAVGLVLGPAVWSGLGTVVRGLPAWDAGVVARFAVLLVATTVAGAMVPAWRAARTAPATLLAEPVA